MAKIEAVTVVQILKDYLTLRQEWGFSDRPLQRGDRSRIMHHLANLHKTTPATINRILSRQSWAIVELPENWIPYV